ncbi:Peptidyl-prolyl cis-trans isomerase [Mycena venus]|uniref:peptidylprolyl isomerase n=1 Tax=Mycena venus TaxID=2733690 RepID=A0A8H6XH18_9AGAR|nr:Peptidyl-prolyl cis-trans isomerase [Mycena venus]
MGVTVDIQEHGDKENFPKKNDVVVIHYDGFIYNTDKPDNKGDKFDSSRDRYVPLYILPINCCGGPPNDCGYIWAIVADQRPRTRRKDPFKTEICVGKVIKGWDEGIPQLSKGSKARLTITPDYGYGARGFPPVIPPHSTLIFEVELLDIRSS